MGNICRSPAAEGVFRHYVQKAGHEDLIEIDSAGTLGYHQGSLPDHRMQEAAINRGYKLDSIARQVIRNDITDFDLIVAMDQDNLRELTNISDATDSHIRLLGSFLVNNEDSTLVQPVPDPYYGGHDGFETVLDIIESACPAILDHCLETAKSR